MRTQLRMATVRRAEQEGLLIRSAILSSYLHVASRVGLNATALLRRVHLDPAAVTNPEILIPAVRATELIELSALTARCRDFGLRLALARGTPDLGPLNLLLREEPDIRSALRSLQSYLHVHSRSLRLVFEEQPGCAILRAGLVEAGAPFAAPHTTEMIVCGIFQSLRWLISARWHPSLVCFTHGPLGEKGTHAAVFGCPVEFNHGFDGLILTKADLDRPVQSSNPGLRRHAEDYVRMLATRSTAGFAEVVTGLIAGLLPSGSCSSTKVALHLGMDRSTLGRRLADVGSSYSGALQETRMRLANRLCLSGVPLEQVGDHLGFASPSTFSRWFSTNFGCSARAWRKRYQSARDGGRSGEPAVVGFDPVVGIAPRR
jgi:AraC-like DNA-binding protein